LKTLIYSKARALLMLTILLSIVLNSCRSPAYNIDVLFDAAIIKYKATLLVTDLNGTNLPNLNLSITGPDAASIYDFSGTKAVYSPGGIITLGVTPKAEPNASKPIIFNIIIKATGYEDLNVPMEISNGQFSQVINVNLLKSQEHTAASAYVLKSAELSDNGTTAATTIINTPITSNVSTYTGIEIPAGTQFKNSTGNLLSGASMDVQLINFDNSDPLSIGLFPGGKLAAQHVVMPGSATPAQAFFLPAASANIKMFIGNEEVKEFTQPLAVTSQLDPNYVSSKTGGTIKAGDQLPIYSYEVETGQFSYESVGTVTIIDGKLSMNFTTSHLTLFVIGEVFSTLSCTDIKTTYTASWLNTGTRPVNIELSTNENKIIYTSTLLMSDGLTDIFKGLPAIPLKYKIIDSSGEILATGNIADPCAGTPLSITLTKPAQEFDNITLQLNVVCPGKGIILVPNFDLYFKPAGSGNAAYTILGTAKSGLIKTTLLKKGSTYDFKATWGNQVKIVPNRPITDLDMSTTVGEGLDLGKNPVTNNALLIEACKSIN